MHETSSVWNLSYKYKKIFFSLLRLLTRPALGSTAEQVFRAVCFVIDLFAVRPHVLRRFLIAQAEKLDLSLPPCQRGEDLGAKLQDGCIFLFSPPSQVEAGLPHSRTFDGRLN